MLGSAAGQTMAGEDVEISHTCTATCALAVAWTPFSTAQQSQAWAAGRPGGGGCSCWLALRQAGVRRLSSMGGGRASVFKPRPGPDDWFCLMGVGTCMHDRDVTAFTAVSCLICLVMITTRLTMM